MPPLLFPLPDTSLLTFSSLLHDPSIAYTTVLNDTTAARTKLHLSLRGVANGEPGSSALAVVDAVQGYLPYLRGLIACLDADELLFKGEPGMLFLPFHPRTEMPAVFPWRSPLTSNGASPQLLSLPSIHSEHLFVILTYVLALSNYAHSVLASLPDFEPSPGRRPHISNEDERKTAAGLARAVDLLCQASGIAEWAAETIVPLVEPVRAASGGWVGKVKWPVEMSAEAFGGLAMTLLSDAHVTAIRKLLLPVLPHSLFAPPGPPLPSSHPSPALLAKLYLHVASLYTSARAALKTHTSEPSSKMLFRSDRDEPNQSDGRIIPAFERYLRKESLLASALAHKWLGVDAGENSGGAKDGEAIAWVKEAKTKLEEMEDGAVRKKLKGLGIGKANDRKKEERKARKGRVERELEDVSAWLSAHTRMNDTVSFQPVPQISSLNIPSGRPIFGAKPFKPPPCKFGPVLHDGEQHDLADPDYAGKGTYY